MLSEESSRVRGARLDGEPAGLRLSEMLKFQVPDEFVGDVLIPHPATLWVLDKDKDGLFSDQDIHAFADGMGRYTHGLIREEWRDMLVGKCYMSLHDDVLRPKRDELMGDSSSSEEEEIAEIDANRNRRVDRASTKDSSRGEPGGLAGYLEWFGKMCVANDSGYEALRKALQDDTKPKLIHVDTVHDLYLAFNVKNASALAFDSQNGTAFQTFLETLQLEAEQKKLMSLEDEQLDDYVPLATLKEFAAGVMRGYRSVNINTPGMARPG